MNLRVRSVTGCSRSAIFAACVMNMLNFEMLEAILTDWKKALKDEYRWLGIYTPVVGVN